jgi:hypothetical protein
VPLSPDRCGDQIASISLAALLSLTPIAARAGQPVGTASGQSGQSSQPSQSGPAKGEEIDAEMLRDLEVLDNPHYARDQEIGKRLSFFERMRMLDRWLSNRPAPEADPNPPAAPAKREVR